MPEYNFKTFAFNLTPGKSVKAVITTGQHFTIDQLFIYCDKTTRFSLYIDRDLGYYDAKNRAWVEQSEHKPLSFNFDTNCKLIAEIEDGTIFPGGVVNVICNVIK